MMLQSKKHDAKMMINQEISMIVDPINDSKTHNIYYTSLK